MNILKFGGSSVANANNIALVKDIVKSAAQKQPLIVVVSALSGVTNLLVQVAEMASHANPAYRLVIDTIEEKHVQLIDELLPNNNDGLKEKVKTLTDKLKEVGQGVSYVAELTPRTNDQIISFGERLSSLIISEYFKGEVDKTSLLDPETFIFTNNEYGKAVVDFEKSNRETYSLLNHFNGVGVCPGFIAKSKSGHISTLGRGGSDYTAAILAGALNATRLEIWTDVSGMMTADPRLVKRAQVINQISYEETMELSHFGAKVIYPPTITPVLKKQIPIHIKNTFEPSHQGTLISSDQNGSGKVIKGLTSMANIALISLKGPGMVGVPNFSHRLFKALSEAEVNVILITQASSEHSISVGVLPSSVSAAQEAVAKEFEFEVTLGKVDPLEVQNGLSIIAMVGNNMQNQVGVSGKLFSTLGHNGVNVVAIAQGSSERNISAVINTKDLKKALNSVHEAFFLSDAKSLNLFVIGVGNVGATLLGQLQSQQSYLYAHYHLDIRVAGIANSRTMYFDQEGNALANWKDKLGNGEAMQLDAFIQKMSEMNLRNSVFVDNTASEKLPNVYQAILSKSISIVTPNKVACSSSYKRYEELKYVSRLYRASLLIETNVGAGLPVISTLNDMIKSGDVILEIQGVLSGSLNFIFNSYDGTRSFADIVRKAQEEGYTEPDPRLDISGKDVMRKLLILAREAGYRLEEDDVNTIPCVPENCMNKEGEDFFKALEKEEPYFKQMYEEAQKHGEKLKYIANFSTEGATIKPMKIDASHPFYNLDGKDNIVLFKTKRYHEQPLVIKGAGAGAEVTASGIFADIIKIANS